MKDFEFYTCQQLINQIGCINKINELCQQKNVQRPLIVTDQGIINAGLLAYITEPLEQAGLAYAVYADVVADPPESVVLAACESAQAHQADVVIGFGGGSAMDTAKLVALLVGSGESLQSVYGVDQAKGPRLPLFLAPTTAGTGSEVTPIAIVTTGENTKAGVVSRVLIPDAALLDASLTVGLPAPVTASTGIDAMVHAIEAYTSVHKKNPYSDMLACEALRLLSANLLLTIAEPQNLEARQAMLLGACLAGQAFANAPVAAVHALAYPLGGQFHISHGLSNSLVLPEVLRFNASVAASDYGKLAPYILGDSIGQNAQSLAEFKNLSDAEKTTAMIAHLVKLSSDAGLPQRLREVDIPASALDSLASDAMEQQRLLINNPRPVSLEDAQAIYQAVY